MADEHEMDPLQFEFKTDDSIYGALASRTVCSWSIETMVQSFGWLSTRHPEVFWDMVNFREEVVIASGTGRWNGKPRAEG